ncbi:NACHT domain-containing protein [Xanthomonas campestris]|uniref:NACHT domain-containing protein n=1 Tax=Xanthomonas campestris TaxID=339 RepID=UPI002B224E63|nr:NACHT domain-containing protein [Xanthomonas campestris]MEA9654744.1 NACHT domain-containing protein [Xanthomonas campestris pv. raphani]
MSANKSIPDKLEVQISEAYKLVLLRESGRDAGVFKAALKNLQALGNAFSHAGTPASPEYADSSGARGSLATALRIAFFANDDLDVPALPDSFRVDIPVRVLQRNSLENLRPEQVVRTWLPNVSVSTKRQMLDHSARLLYDYVEAVAGGLRFGVVFLRTRTAIEKSLADFFANVGKVPDSLCFVTPRVYRTDGRLQDRKGSIQAALLSRKSALGSIEAKVEYFDEFVWNNCLPDHVRNYKKSPSSSLGVIPQYVQPITRDGAVKGPMTRKQYVDVLRNNSGGSSPIHVIVGPAGIGKTTFCDLIADDIGVESRRRVVLLSATDFREVSPTKQVRSVSDLYMMAVEEGFTEAGESIDSHNFEVNLGCGNFVLMIDGFDELESHLGADLDFEAFISSLTDLEESFRNVLVVLTVRDYGKERFLKVPSISLVQLRGFDRGDTELYLLQELTAPQVVEANHLLESFSVDEDPDPQTVPLYASLIRDYIRERNAGAVAPPQSDSAKMFAADLPLDRLIKKIVDRELGKQSLGNISADDFFHILIDIINAPSSRMSREEFSKMVVEYGGDASTLMAENFLRNPFISCQAENITFRYDSLSYFFKSRLLVTRIRDGVFSVSPTVEFMSEMFRGDGPLFVELCKMYPARMHGTDSSVKRWFAALLAASKGHQDSLQWKRAISGFLYWLVDASQDKAHRRDLLISSFAGDMWETFSVFGRFYSLDLRGITVFGGYIDGFESLGQSDFECGSPVFFDSYVNFDDRSLPPKLDREIFDVSCTLSANMEAAFTARETASILSFDMVRENIYRLLKVGFKSHRFSWKSEAVYRKVTVLGKHSRDVYLRTLVDRGVLVEEVGRTSAEKGYCVNPTWQKSARSLIEESNLSMEMTGLVSGLVA